MGDEIPEWLPPGWEIEVKVRNTGRKDKYYINLENGLKLSSMPEVLRYLNSSGKDRKRKEATGASICMVSQKPKIDIEKTVSTQLPPGWIKEIRKRKTGSKTKRDAYYIDPVNGRQFRSMQEVARYTESKDSGKARAKPGGKGHDTLEFGDHSKSSSGEAKGQRSIDKKPDKHLSRNQRLKSGVTHASGLKGGAMKNINMLEDNHLEKSEDDSLASMFSEDLQRVNRKKRRADKVVVIKKLDGHQVDKKGADSDQSLKSGAEVIGPTNVDMQREKEDEFVAGDVLNKSPQVDVKEQVDGGSRRSLRIAGRKLKNIFTEDQYSKLGLEGYAEETIKFLESNDLEQRERNESKSTVEGQQHKNLSRKKKRKTTSSKRSSDLLGKIPKRLAQIETEHPSLEIKTGNKSGVSATLPDESEATTAKSVVKDGQLDEPLIDDANAKINDCENQGQHKNLVRQKKRKNPISRCTSDLPGRTLKRLAQIEADRPSLEVKMGKKSGVSATLLDEAEVTTTKNVVEDGLSVKTLIVDISVEISNDRENPVNNEDQQKNLVREKRKKIPNRRYRSDLPGGTSKGPGKTSKGPGRTSKGPVRTSKGLAQVEVKHPSLEIKTSNTSGITATLSDESVVTTTKNVVKDGASNEPLIDDNSGRESKKLNSPLEELLMDPCIEFAFKTLTGAIPIEEEVSKLGGSTVSSLSLPNQTPTPKLASSQIWSDPCFEFAVKMLTGEMPAEDNSFQQPSVSSLDNANSSRSCSFSQFDDVKEPSLIQQGVKDPSFPHGASGGSQNSVGARRQ